MLINWLPAALVSRRTRVRSSTTKRKQVTRRLGIERAEERVVLAAWTELGPAPINNGQIAGSGAVSGRLTGIAADPNDANTIYVAAAGGGVWKTTNGGTSWAPLTDNVTDGSGNPIPEFMGAVAETDAVGGAHNGQQIVYAGTGEANNSGDSFYGSGILVSTNGGGNWTLTTASGALKGRTVSKIAIDPTDPTGATAYAAVGDFAVDGNFGNTGIWKTTNFGQTWTNVTAAAPNNLSTADPWSDVVVDPKTGDIFAAEGNIFGASGNGVYKSTDHGATWALLSGSGTANGTQDGRITLAIFDQSSTDELFVSIEDPNTSGLLKMLKSTDGGSTFTDLTSKVLAANDYLGQQGWYDTTLGIDPKNPSIIYAAGDMNRQGPTFSGSPLESVDGGNTWQVITTDSKGNSPHTDSHSLAFDKNGNVLEGDDGGIWRLENTGTLATQTWTDLNSNLGTIQFTGIAVDPTNGDVYGGSQDNGTEEFTGLLGWNHIADGDGGFTRIDPTNHNIVYSEYAGTDVLQVSFNGGASFSFVGGPAGNSNFYAPYVLDQFGDVYYGGDGLYLSKNHGTTFTQIATAGSNGFSSGGANIDAVAVSPTNDNVVYVSANGQIFATQNAQAANPTWSAVTLPGGGAVGAGNGIAVDASDLTGATAYAVVNSFGSQRVFKTTNFGANWTNITGDLPNTPVWSVAVNGSNLYVGTDIGVYTSTNGGTNWTVMGTGLPQAQVTELVDVASTNTLYAGTHGRGAWSISTLSAPPSLTIPIGPVTYISAGGPIALAAGASLTNGNSSYATGNLTVQITNNGSAFDQLVIQNTGGITTSGANVLYNGNAIGAFVGGTGGAPLVVTFTTAFANTTSVQALVRAIDFNNSAVTPTTLQRTVQFTVSDGTNVTAPQDVLVNVQVAGPVIDFSGVTPITYTATNPPMLLAPTATVTDLATSNFFGNGGQLDVTITSNSDANDRLSFQVGGSITVSANAVYYLGNDFATFSGGSGSSPLVFAFDSSFATTAAVQALINAITYRNLAITPSTQTRTVSFSLTDSQPITSATVTTQVNVQLSVPTITLAGPAPQTFAAHGAPVLIAPGSRVTDPIDPLMGGHLTVTLSNNASASDQLLVLNQGSGAGQIGVSGSTVSYGGLVIGTINGGQNGVPLTVTFTTADATVAAVQALVQDIAFSNSSASPATVQRTVTLKLVDEQPAASSAVNVLIDVVQVDHAPRIDLNTSASTWTEGTPPIALAAGATVTYDDDTNFNGGSLTVSLPTNGTPADLLSIQSLGGITVSGANVLFNGSVFGTVAGGTNGNPLSITFTNTKSTVAAVQALVQAIGFSNSSINPSLTPRTVQFVLKDGHSQQSMPVTMAANVSGVDNPPSLVLGPSLPYEADTSPTAIAPAAMVADSDTPFFAGGSLVVTETFGQPSDLLVVLNQGKGANQIGVSGTSVSDGGTLIGTITSFGSLGSPLSISLNGSASLSDVQDLVRAIGFGTTGPASSQTRSFAFTLNDGGGAAAVAQNISVAVSIGSVPPLVVLQPSMNYTAGSLPVTVSANAVVSDSDSSNFDGGSLAVSLAHGATVYDRLSIQSQGSSPGQVLVNGNNVYYGGILVGTLNADAGIGLNPLVVTFNQQSSSAAAAAILSAMQFGTTGPNSAGTRLLQVVLTDNTQLPSTPAVEQINVSMPANPVTLTLSSPSMNYLRGSGPLFIDAGATLTDVTATTFARGTLTFQVHGGTKNHVTIANTADIQVKNGKVRFDGLLIGTVSGGTVHLNASATQSAVEALMQAVTFSTNGVIGIRTATFAFNDGHGGTASASKSIFVS